MSAEGDVETLRAAVSEVRRKLKGAWAPEVTLRSESQQLAALASNIARITSDAMSGLGTRPRSVAKVMVRAVETYANSSASAGLRDRGFSARGTSDEDSRSSGELAP